MIRLGDALLNPDYVMLIFRDEHRVKVRDTEGEVTTIAFCRTPEAATKLIDGATFTLSLPTI